MSVGDDLWGDFGSVFFNRSDGKSVSAYVEVRPLGDRVNSVNLLVSTSILV